jgi:hypothetical protein
MTRGVVLFGVNNTKIDYVQLCVMAAAFVKKNMPGTSVSLITDEPSYYAQESKGKWSLSDFFDNVVMVPSQFKENFSNARKYKDTRYYGIEAAFRNESRSLIYELTPYDETLLIDSDYLVCNNSLSAVWGSSEDVMINTNATGLLHNKLEGAEFRLNPFGIKMYWATVIYFKKNERAKLLFDLVEHIKENWDFYKLTYDFPGHLYRNDYAFSIAIHILNGFVESDEVVSPLPDDSIFTALDTDQFFKIRSPSDMSFFANDTKETWKFYATRIKGLNVHCMNKLSLLNNMDSIMEVLQ